MKKSLILVGMLAIGYANAQEGVVGINTSEPKATLQVTPSAENAKATATTNEGIMAPQLSKSRVAGIATPVEGTLVYITDETTSPISAYTGADAKVAKITEKGYYYYNGTEWVKAAGANGNIYTTNGTITEDRTITFEQNGRLNLLGTANIGKNAEALGIVGQDHTYFGFYPQGLNEGRKAFMGFNTTGAKDLTIQNENENGKILLKNATQVTGDLTASSLSGTGDRPVVAAADGTLKIGSAGQTGVVSASRGLIYDANKKDIALPPGTSTDQVLKWDGTKWVAYTMPSNDISIAKPVDYDYKVGDVISQPVKCSEKNIGMVIADFFTGQTYKCFDLREDNHYNDTRWGSLFTDGTFWNFWNARNAYGQTLNIGYDENDTWRRQCQSWRKYTDGTGNQVYNNYEGRQPCLGIRIK